VLVIMRVWRLDQMTHRLAWALGVAVSFVTLLWAMESSFAPVHWQRDGSLSVLMGCLASAEAVNRQLQQLWDLLEAML